MSSSELTRRHFSTRVYKCYLHLLKTSYPEIDLEALCAEAGLPLSYLLDENNWVSVLFDSEFCRLCVEKTGQANLCFQAGRQNSREAVLGRAVYLVAKYSLSLELTYRQMPRMVGFYSQVTRLEVVGSTPGLVRYRLSPDRLETLEPHEKQALRANFENILLNNVGHFSALPTIQDLPIASVDYEQTGFVDEIPVFELRVRYPASQHLVKHLSTAARTGSYLAASAVLAWVASILGAGLRNSAYLFVTTYLLLELRRSRKTIRQFFQILDLSMRDYELLDRRYEALQTAKESIEAISRVNSHYRALVDEMQLGVCILRNDAHSPFGVSPVITNRAFEALADLPGQNRTSFMFLPAILNECLPLVKRAIESNVSEVIDTLSLHLPGSKTNQYYSLHVFPVHPDRAGIIIEDITAKTLYRLALDEERMKAVQTGKLAALGEMAAGISHELNNPLTIIRAHAERVATLIETGLESAEGRNRVQQASVKIVATVDRMAKIIRGVRAFSRDASRDPMAVHDLHRILQDSLELCEKWIASHGVKINISGFAAGMELQCRDVEISQVLVNLIRNASDALENSKEKWINLSVSEHSDFYSLKIMDSGPGIPEELREKIFSPFFTTKEVGKGTGLGLSIAKGIIEKHGGTLELDLSSPNTCFSIRLPKGKQKQQGGKEESSPDSDLTKEQAHSAA